LPFSLASNQHFNRREKELSVEIRFADTLTDEERQTLFGWGENIFGVEDHLYRWRPKELHFITEEDGRVVSHVGVLKTEVTAGGREITVGGVGGVVTIPEAQGRRYVHTAMRRAAEFMRGELGVEFGMLFCLPRLAPFYARQGWQLLEEEVEFEQPTGKIISPFRVMALACDGRVWPAGRVEIAGLPW
jgi:predicted N-acetyltransferase YhbS